MISQTGVGRRDDAPQIDSNPPTELSIGWGADVDSSARLLHELEVLSNTSPAAPPPVDSPSSSPKSANPPTVPPSVMRS